MKANMKRLGWESSIEASSNQDGQAAEEKKTKGRGGLDAAKTFLAPAQGEAFFA